MNFSIDLVQADQKPVALAQEPEEVTEVEEIEEAKTASSPLEEV